LELAFFDLNIKARELIESARSCSVLDRDDTVAIIEGLKSGKIGYLGLDVYEEEEEIFFEDRPGLILSDEVFAQLLTFPNVIITGHQAFFTREALLNIAAITIDNITKFQNNQPLRSWSADFNAAEAGVSH
jgi:lactate dehydrogenase-like 2-hydroxyacid dehydrogenase